MATMYDIDKNGKLINPVEVPEKSEPFPVRLNRLVGFILSAGTLLLGGFMIKTLLYQKGLFLPLSGLWCVATSIWIAIAIRK